VGLLIASFQVFYFLYNFASETVCFPLSVSSVVARASIKRMVIVRFAAA
jgi:hypothetical protein